MDVLRHLYKSFNDPVSYIEYAQMIHDQTLPQRDERQSQLLGIEERWPKPLENSQKPRQQRNKEKNKTWLKNNNATNITLDDKGRKKINRFISTLVYRQIDINNKILSPLLPDKNPIGLDYRQLNAILRFILVKKWGMLLLHKVGTGKTLTSLLIALNLIRYSQTDKNQTSKSIVIISPPGIFGEFIKDMSLICPSITSIKNLRKDNSEYANTHFPTSNKKEFKGTNEDYIFIFGKTGTDEGQFSIRLENYDYPTLIQDMSKRNISRKFDNKIVIIDEAHRLLANTLPNSTQSITTASTYHSILNDRLFNASIKKARNVILLSGTPIISDLGDMCRLGKFLSQKMEKPPDFEITTYTKYKPSIATSIFVARHAKDILDAITPLLKSGVNATVELFHIPYFQKMVSTAWQSIAAVALNIWGTAKAKQIIERHSPASEGGNISIKKSRKRNRVSKRSRKNIMGGIKKSRKHHIMSNRSRKNITRITGGGDGVKDTLTTTAVATVATKATAVQGNLGVSQLELDQLIADFNKFNFDTHLLAKTLYPYISIYDYSENVQGTNKCNFIQQNNAEEAIQEMEKFPHLNMKIIECYYSGEQLKLMYDFITHGIDDIKRSLFNIVLLENKDLNVRGRQKFLERRTNGKFIGTYSNAYLKYEFILMGSQEAAHVRDEVARGITAGDVAEANEINAFSSAFCKYQTVNMDDTITNVRWCSKFYLILEGLEKLAKDTTFFDYTYTKPNTPEEIDTIKQKTRKEYSDQISIDGKDNTLYNMKKANAQPDAIRTQEDEDREFIDNYNSADRERNMKGITLTVNTDPQPHVEKEVDTVTPTIMNKSADGADREIDGSCSVIVTDKKIDVWFNGRTKISNKFSQDERNALERVAASDGIPVPKWVSDKTVTNMSYNIDDVLFFAGKTEGALKYPEFTIKLNKADVDILSEKSKNLTTKLTSPIPVTTEEGNYNNGNTSYYLPLVYSYSENIGLAPFACYLTEKKKKYVLLHSIQATKKISRWHFKNCLDILTNDINRQDVILYNKFAPKYYKARDRTDESLKAELDKLLKEELENSSYSLLDLNKFMAFTIKYPHNNNNTDNKQPICVLLDPTMTEGFNAKYNPALFIIEPCNSFGDSEQVNGRILRKYGRDDVSNPKWLNNKTNKNKAQLFQKYVYQFSITKDRTDEQNNPDWYTKNNKDQFEKASNWNNPFLSLIRNIRNKDFTEAAWLRTIKDVLTGGLTDKTDIYAFYEYRTASYKFDFVYPESYISKRIQHARKTLIDLEVNCTSRSNTINCGDEDDIIGYILENHTGDLVNADDYTSGIQNRLFANSSKPTEAIVRKIMDEIDASENDEGEFTDAAAQKKEDERAAEEARVAAEAKAAEALRNGFAMRINTDTAAAAAAAAAADNSSYLEDLNFH